MPNYSYTSMNSEGKTFKGTMNATNESDLEYKLNEIGLELINAKKQGGGQSFLTLSGSIKNKDIILLCTHFEQLDKAGVPLTSAIEDLRDSSDSQEFRDMMQGIYESVKAGKLLSESLAQYPKVFNEVFVGLVAAGEKTGTLYKSFSYLGEHLRWSEEIRRATSKAIKYPLFLLVVLFIVLSIMMIYVIPKLSDFLLKQQIDLPLYSKALIATSEFFQTSWYMFIIIPLTLYIFNKIMYNMNSVYAYAMDAFKLRVPFLGTTLRKIDVARFSEFFMITFKSGIEVMHCLEIASKVVNNRVLKRSVDKMRKDIADGSSISKALKVSGNFPSLVVRMFEVGEQTGNMSDSLNNIKYFYDREVKDSVEKLIGMIQPFLTIVMGGLLMWISLSVFGPLYSSFGNIQ